MPRPADSDLRPPPEHRATSDIRPGADSGRHRRFRARFPVREARRDRGGPGRRAARRLLLAGVLLAALGLAGGASGEENAFVAVSDGRLTLGGSPFTFTGLNVWNAAAPAAAPQFCGAPTDLSSAADQFGSGVQVVRAWFFQRLATSPGGDRDWTALDQALRAAGAHGLKVIAVLGNQWADCEGYSSAADGYKDEDWYRDGYRMTVPPGQRATYEQWVREVVSRYQDDPTIMMWQLVNEPEDASSLGGSCPPRAGAVLRSFARTMGREVKALDPRHLLGMGTIGSGQCGTSDQDYVALNAVPFLDVADYHDYSVDPVPGDRWNGLAARAREMAALGKPLIVGEVGIVPDQVGGTDARAALILLKVFADLRLGASGVLLWAWRPAEAGGTNPSGYDIGPGDPALSALASR